MKRKLIKYDAFEELKNKSLSASEAELIEAAPILAHSLKCENLKLISYGPETAMFEAVDGTFIHANYKVANNALKFENIEQLAIDTDTEKNKSRETVSLLVDALLENNTSKADQLFSNYMELPLNRRVLKEAVLPKAEKAEKKCGKMMKKEVKFGKKPTVKASKKKMNEWHVISENVLDYVNYQELGPVAKQSQVKADNAGNVVAVQVPTKNARNEAKLLSFNWKTLATDVKVLRSGAQKLSEDTKFCKSISELKRHNAMSDNASLEESLESIVSNWPGVLYLTQDELAKTIKEALEVTSSTNYDDKTCEFMAEGILRTAHNAYVDRVSKITKLAGAEETNCTDCDKYAEFKTVVDSYFPSLDENSAVEMQVFVDLYNALREVYEITDETSRMETANHLDELQAVIEKNVQPTIEIAQSAAAWLNYVVETNLEMQTWNVSNSTHSTVNGDHPDMAKKAKTGYTPASDFSGDYGDSAPVSDGKKVGSGDEMRNSSWGNSGGKDVYPDLNNPYIPAPFGDYTMKGEKGVDKDQGDLSAPVGGDTWPALQNPYIPKSVEPKMKSDDLVVDA